MSLLTSVPPLREITLGKITLLDSTNKYYLTVSDTSIVLSVGYVVGESHITQMTFKYRINSGSWNVYAYGSYTQSHTFTGLSLTEGDIVEGRITVQKDGGNVYYSYPRVPVVMSVVSKESISYIQRMRRDFNVIISNHGFSIHHFVYNVDILDCPECYDSEFGRYNPHCEVCDGTGVSGGYDNANIIRAVLQEKIPYALHGDANIFTKIGLFDRADATIFVKHTISIDSADKIFYKGFRWKVMNDVTIPVAGAIVFYAHTLTREVGVPYGEK